MSYKPIPPPAWLLLPGEQLLEKSFHAMDLPEIFKLDLSAHCSCGSNQGINLTVDDIVVFTTTTAILRKIETSYYISCSNKKGRAGSDLCEFGVFNWNNRVAFSHELMNEYTSRFTTSMTPFFRLGKRLSINTYPNNLLGCSSVFTSSLRHISASFVSNG